MVVHNPIGFCENRSKTFHVIRYRHWWICNAFGGVTVRLCLAVDFLVMALYMLRVSLEVYCTVIFLYFSYIFWCFRVLQCIESAVVVFREKDVCVCLCDCVFVGTSRAHDTIYGTAGVWLLCQCSLHICRVLLSAVSHKVAPVSCEFDPSITCGHCVECHGGKTQTLW